MGQFSVEKPVAPGSVLSGNQHVLDLLPPQRGQFNKEDGERVVDYHGQRIAMG